MSKVFVIGGGASGMLAAIVAARNGHKVEIFEKNEKLGKKLYITGKGRCNLTNACDQDTFFSSVVSNPKFLYRAFHDFNNFDLIDLFQQLGLPVKIERGNRAFPESDKSSDVINSLKEELLRLKVKINYKTVVSDILARDDSFYGLKLSGDNNEYIADSLIVATGGLSYPTTGSTGDGYEFAKKIGHTITKLDPSLVPIHVKEEYVKELMGLSLKNIELSITSNNSIVYHDFGELLFTHFGVSGPVILSASSYIIPYLSSNKELELSIDLKPALTHDQLDNRILRDF
ncbi:MAG: aminoacetone oxidase family FAD-binding enzyme, partial [Clostridiales bacterium]|nr:aminoacetone oxidase family FAD-binding enzyme [Clostridiales bacterium]